MAVDVLNKAIDANNLGQPSIKTHIGSPRFFASASGEEINVPTIDEVELKLTDKFDDHHYYTHNSDFYLIREDFRGDIDAPITSIICTPGPGTLLVNDDDNSFISNGYYNQVDQVNTGNLLYESGTHSRVVGRIYTFEFKTPDNDPAPVVDVGIASASGRYFNAGMQFTGTRWFLPHLKNGNGMWVRVVNLSSGSTYYVDIVTKETGYFAYVREPGSASFNLWGIDEIDVSPTVKIQCQFQDNKTGMRIAQIKATNSYHWLPTWLATDDFSDRSGSIIGSTNSLGVNEEVSTSLEWEVLYGDWEITASGTLLCTSTSGFIVVDPGISNYWVDCVVTTSGHVQLGARITDENNGWFIYHSGAGNVRLLEVIDGSNNSITQNIEAINDLSFSNNDRFWMNVIDNHIAGAVSVSGHAGTNTCTTATSVKTSTTHQNATKCGVRTFTANMEISLFRIMSNKAVPIPTV